MKRILVDTNIVFSALLNMDSRIGRILIQGKFYYEFYAPEYLKEEIQFHKHRIMDIGKLSQERFDEVYELVLKNITLLDHSLLPEKLLSKALDICGDIDPDDAYFLGFSFFLKAQLWTGDKKLVSGLQKKKISLSVSTEELYKDFIQQDRRR